MIGFFIDYAGGWFRSLPGDDVQALAQVFLALLHHFPLFGDFVQRHFQCIYNLFRILVLFVYRKTNKDGTTENIFKESGLHLVRLAPRTASGTNFGGYLVNGSGQKVYGVSERTLSSAIVQPTFDNIKDTNWSEFIAIKTNYRKATALFMLSAQDVAQLDFMRPIYLRQYAQSYIVTKVNYQPKGSTVEMLLIR